MKVDPANVLSTRQGLVQAVPSPDTELYVKADIWIPSSAAAAFPSNTNVLVAMDEATGANDG